MSAYGASENVTVTVTWAPEDDLDGEERKSYAFYNSRSEAETFMKEVEDYMELDHRTKYYEKYDLLIVPLQGQIIFPDDICDVEISDGRPTETLNVRYNPLVMWHTEKSPMRDTSMLVTLPVGWFQRPYFNFRFPKKNPRAKKRKRSSVYVLVEAEEDEEGAIRIPNKKAKA